MCVWGVSMSVHVCVGEYECACVWVSMSVHVCGEYECACVCG